MPTVEDVIQVQNELVGKAQALISRKGNDYNGQQQLSGDTLFNMRVASLLGIVPNSVDSVLVRLSDKFMRLVSLTRPGATRQVSNESLEDTIVDAINYLTYVLVFLREAKHVAVTPPVVPDVMPANAYIAAEAEVPAKTPAEFLEACGK